MSYTKCIKSFLKGRITEKRSQIGVREYYSIRELEVPGKSVVKKTRSSFMYNGNNFILDTFTAADGLVASVLVVQGLKDKKTIEMPDIISKNIVAEMACELSRRKGGDRHRAVGDQQHRRPPPPRHPAAAVC